MLHALIQCQQQLSSTDLYPNLLIPLLSQKITVYKISLSVTV